MASSGALSASRVIAQRRGKGGRSGSRHNLLHAIHEKEELKRQSEQARGGLCGALTQFYSVPLVKFLVRAMWHVLFLLLFFEVLTHLHTVEQLAAIAPRLPHADAYEKLFVVWALALYYENRQRKVTLRDFGLSTDHLPFQKATSHGHTLLAVAILLRIFTFMPLAAYVDGGEWLPAAQAAAYIGYQRLLSFDAVLLCVELFTFMWVSRDFGVLAIIMGQMLVDLSLFLVFALVLLLGFSAALLGLSETASIHTADGDRGGGRLLAAAGAAAAGAGVGAGAGAEADAAWSSAGRALHRHNGGLGGEDEAHLPLLAVPLWAMFTDLDVGQLLPIPFAPPLMLAYVLLANVVLVNLLIAMFADTYSRIKKNAELEYHYQRFLHIFEYVHVVHATPPPFSIPLLLLDSWRELRASCRRRYHGKSARLLSAAEALHRVAAERPEQPYGVGGASSATGTSKKYVQSFLKDRDGETSTLSAAAMYKKLEALISGMDEKVGGQLERLDTQISPEQNEQTRALMQLLIQKLDSRGGGGGGGGITSMGLRAAGLAAKPSAFCSMMLGKTSDSAPSGVARSVPAGAGAGAPGSSSAFNA